MTQANLRTWIARSLIGFILLVNVQCAVAFLVSPDIFAPGFEVGGVVGSGIVRGMGILFNVERALCNGCPGPDQVADFFV